MIVFQQYVKLISISLFCMVQSPLDGRGKIHETATDNVRHQQILSVDLKVETLAWYINRKRWFEPLSYSFFDNLKTSPAVSFLFLFVETDKNRIARAKKSMSMTWK